MLSSDFLKTAEVLGLGRQVNASKLAAAKSTWKSSQTRSGSRPLHVETMLRKEKDGTLTKYTHKPRPPEEEKTASWARAHLEEMSPVAQRAVAGALGGALIGGVGGAIHGKMFPGEPAPLMSWSQALDNTAPDVMFSNGNPLHGPADREKLVSGVSRLASNFDRRPMIIPGQGEANVITTGRHRMLELVPEGRLDVVGRKAPVVVMGDARTPEAEWIQQALQEVARHPKTASLSQPGGADYSEPGTDPSAAKFMAPQRIPSREDSAGADVKRQDGRDFATTLPAPGTFLNDVGPQPAYIKTSAGPGLAGLHAEHMTDLAGLGLMGLGSASKLYGQVADKGSGPISAPVQGGLDLAGLGAMSAPTLAALGQLARGAQLGEHHAGGGSTLVNVANLAGLGALAIPTADKVQAHIRARKGGDVESKMLLGHKAHKALELGGYGALITGALANSANDPWEKAMITGGYGALAAPTALDMKDGPGRTSLELAGLGALAVPSAVALSKHSSLDKQALLERLIRLGATDIPGTPRMLMRHRSPEELGQLQQGVTDTISKVKEPLRAKGTGVVERLANKLPNVGGKVRIPFTQRVLNLRAPTMAAAAGKWAVNRGLDHPDALLAHIAVGGALPVVPGAGWAADAGAVKLKQLAERLIDMHLPVPLHA